jgi:hypothetical protein
MSPVEAAKILDLPVDASPEQIETRFNELRAKLEDKIAKAPTPGLKAKYRESLDDITAAFEALTLAADSSSLPIRNKPVAGGADPGSKTQPSTPGSTPPATSASRGKKKSSSEFLIVAVIALAVLGAGGWWVMKTRAENAEKARLATQLATELAEKSAQQKAETEQAARTAAQRAEEEKVRIAAEAKAEQTRREQLGLQLRTRISELNIALDALLKSESLAERELSDLKAEERSLQREAKGGATPDLRAAQVTLQAHDRYVAWLRDNLATSPARTTRAKIEELSAAKAWDEVAAVVDPYAAAIKQLQDALAAKRTELLTLDGTLLITAEPAEVDFTLKDSYGRTRTGRTPAELSDVPFGRASVTFRREGWAELTKTVTIARNADATATVDLVGGRLDLTSTPFAVDYVLSSKDRTEKGRTPGQYSELPAGEYTVRFTRPGWPDQTKLVSVPRAGSAALGAEFAPAGSVQIDSTPAGAEVSVDGKSLGVTPLTLADQPPGAYAIAFKLDGHVPAQASGELKGGARLVLAAKLEKKVLTKDEAFQEFWHQAAGVWRGGNSPNFLRVTAGSTTIIRRLKFLGTDDSKIIMEDYEPDTGLIRTSSFLNPTRWIAVRNGKLQYGGKDVEAVWERVADSEW